MALTLIRHDNFDEYTRRQYLMKGPSKNPFGDDEAPLKFSEFDIFTKLRVLVQLSQWTMINAERMRQYLPEATESEQLQWVCVLSCTSQLQLIGLCKAYRTDRL